MEKKGNDSLQEELRSSQVYHVLTGSGIPLAGKIAQGLGAAAQGLDQALNMGKNPGSGNAGHPYQAPPQNGPYQAPPYQNTYREPPQTAQTRQTPPSQGNPQPSQGAARNAGSQNGNGYYHYSYNKGAAQQGAPRQQVRPPQPPYPPQSKAQRVAAAQRAAAARHEAQQQAAAARRKAGQRKAGAAAPAAGNQPPMKMVRAGSPAKFYITAAAALIYATSAPLYETYHFVIFAWVLVLVFLVSGALFRGKKVFVPIQPEKPKEEPKKEPEKVEKSQTGNPEVDKIIDEGREYLKKLRAADDAIPDETLSEDITRMERASADIFRYIADHPEKAPQIRKFMNYYLPTTLKLLGSYQRLSQQNVKGENISSTLFNIAGMMHTVADAFEKQLDSLYAEEAMDISADITVFETLLKQEGFVDEDKQEQEEAKK